jgi:hypothetical protein
MENKTDNGTCLRKCSKFPCCLIYKINFFDIFHSVKYNMLLVIKPNNFYMQSAH